MQASVQAPRRSRCIIGPFPWQLRQASVADIAAP
jgi:hypothetical protein